MRGPEGKLILTAPFGLASDGWQRVYDSKRLCALLSGFSLEKIQYFKKHKANWVEVAGEALAAVDSSKATQGVALLVARKLPGTGQ